VGGLHRLTQFYNSDHRRSAVRGAHAVHTMRRGILWRKSDEARSDRGVAADGLYEHTDMAVEAR
jgi:hypothetical protein